MKKGIIWITLTCLIVASMILTSCSKTTTTTSTSTTTSTTIATQITTTTTASPITTSTTTTTAGTGHWWDTLGKPQYGGEMTIRLSRDIVQFDPYGGYRLADIESAWMERMFVDDWTLDPSVFDFRIGGRPSEYEAGLLAENWEFSDPSTFVVHLRKGVRWQNIAPANGREFVADDVVFHYDRMLGLGDGFTQGSPNYAFFAGYQYMASVTATDKYTVVFKWSISAPESILETTMRVPGADVDIESPEAVKQWGNLNDWHHAIGTGPFILTDFVSGGSATLDKNQNYWGYDERYPQNKLPYIDRLNILIIPDFATALAALRSGKIDVMDQLPYNQAQSVQKTNPEILQLSIPTLSANSVDPRNDVAPFTDIRVREAMQMAIDLPTIAKTYYFGTTDPYPATFIGRYLKGWGSKYEDWPQSLKDEYAYNPTAAKKLLADAGYPNGFKTDVVADIAADLDLLQIVKSYFSAIGIDMDIRTLDSASWISYVTAVKQDQMDFRAGSVLGATDAPVLQLYGYHTGYSGNYMKVSDPVFDAYLDKALVAPSVDAAKQIVDDASLRVSQQHYVIALLQPKLFALYQPWLKGYNGQDQSVSGFTAPRLLCFYEARFWIDQNIKKSFGK